MKRTSILLYTVSIAVLVVAFLVYAKTNLILPQYGDLRLLVDKPSLRVLVNKKFPEDLACIVFVGEHSWPNLAAWGQKGRITSASIAIDPRSYMHIWRKEGKTGADAFMLSLFLDDNVAGARLLRDLNADGEWDVKVMPRMNQQHFISYQGAWLPVDKVQGVLLDIPIAVKGSEKYEFRDKWVLTNPE